MKIIDTANHSPHIKKLSKLHPGECFETKDGILWMVCMLDNQKYYLDLETGYLCIDDEENTMVIQRFVKMLI